MYEAMNSGETGTRANFLWLLCREKKLEFPSTLQNRLTVLGIGLIINACGIGRKNVDATSLRRKGDQLCFALASSSW